MEWLLTLPRSSQKKKNCLCPHNAVMFFNEVKQRILCFSCFVFFLVGLLSCEFITFSQVIVLPKTECTDCFLKKKKKDFFLNVANVATLQVFFTLNFLWFQSQTSSRDSSSERKQRMRHSKKPTITYTFIWQHVGFFFFFYFLFWTLTKVTTSVNAENILHSSEYRRISKWAKWIITFMTVNTIKEPRMQFHVSKGLRGCSSKGQGLL